MQKPTNLVQGDLFRRVIRIYAMHDYQIQRAHQIGDPLLLCRVCSAWSQLPCGAASRGPSRRRADGRLAAHGRSVLGRWNCAPVTKANRKRLK